MAAPTLITTVNTGWSSTTANTRSVPSLNVLTGDILISCSSIYATSPTLSMSGGGSWTPEEGSAGFTSNVFIYSQVVASDNAALSLTLNRSGAAGTPYEYGAIVYQFRGSSGTGVSDINVGSGLPTLTLPTLEGVNSALVVFSADEAGVFGPMTWLTNAGSFTEVLDDESWTVFQHSGYHPDAGAIASYVVGMSDPDLQSYNIVGIEVKGTVTPPPTVAWFVA